MTKELKDFLDKIIDNNNLPKKYRDEAKEIVTKQFNLNVIEVFDYFLDNEYNAYSDLKKAIRERRKTKFVKDMAYYTEANEFLETFWNDIDLILDILNKYLDELEKED